MLQIALHVRHELQVSIGGPGPRVPAVNSGTHLSSRPAGWAAAAAGKPSPAMQQIIAAARTHAGRGTMAQLARLVEDPPLLLFASRRRRSRDSSVSKSWTKRGPGGGAGVGGRVGAVACKVYGGWDGNVWVGAVSTWREMG